MAWEAIDIDMVQMGRLAFMLTSQGPLPFSEYIHGLAIRQIHGGLDRLSVPARLHAISITTPCLREFARLTVRILVQICTAKKGRM